MYTFSQGNILVFFTFYEYVKNWNMYSWNLDLSRIQFSNTPYEISSTMKNNSLVYLIE